MNYLVLWDIDHTLVENNGISKQIYLGAYREITGGVSPVQPITEGRTDRLIMRDLFQMSGTEVPPWSDIHHALVRAGKSHLETLSRIGWVLPGAVEAIDALTNSGSVVQGILTGNIRENAFVKLKAFGLDALFDFDLGAYGSDHEDRYSLVAIACGRVAQKTGRIFLGHETVLIGDTPRDVEAARRNGARIIAVASGVDSVAQLIEAGAQMVLPSLVDTSCIVNAVLDDNAHS